MTWTKDGLPVVDFTDIVVTELVVFLVHVAFSLARLRLKFLDVESHVFQNLLGRVYMRTETVP